MQTPAKLWNCQAGLSGCSRWLAGSSLCTRHGWRSFKSGLGIISTLLVCNTAFVAVFVPGIAHSIHNLNSEMDGIRVKVAGVNKRAGPVLAPLAQFDPLGGAFGFQGGLLKQGFLCRIHFLLDSKSNFIPSMVPESAVFRVGWRFGLADVSQLFAHLQLALKSPLVFKICHSGPRCGLGVEISSF